MWYADRTPKPYPIDCSFPRSEYTYGQEGSISTVFKHLINSTLTNIIRLGCVNSLYSWREVPIVSAIKLRIMKMQFTALLLWFALSAIWPFSVHCQDTIPSPLDELPPKSPKLEVSGSETPLKPWHFNGGLGIIGRGVLLDASFQLGLNANSFVSLGYGGAARTSKNKPYDYNGGLVSFFLWGAENVETSSTFHLTFGAQAFVTNSMIWSIEAGPSLGSCTIIEYTRKDSPRIGANYYTDEKQYKVVPGFTVKAMTRWVVSDAFGLDIGLVGNLNKRYSYGALKLGMNIGQLK